QSGRANDSDGEGGQSDWPVPADGAALEPSGIHAQCRGNSSRQSCLELPANMKTMALIRFSMLLGIALALGYLLQAAEQYALPPETAGFKNGPGVELAIAQCLLCHSADYVSTQPRLSRTAWKAT